MTLIKMGADVIDRADTIGINLYTAIEGEILADGTGKITKVEMWLDTSGIGVKVATFYDAFYGDNTFIFSTHDYETIGDVPSGSKQTFTGLDMYVVTGDCIGIHAATQGRLEFDISGGTEIWHTVGGYIPCSSKGFTRLAGYAISLYGEGETLIIVAPTVTTQAATNVQATTARLNGQISDDGGEACQYRFRYKKSGSEYSYTTWAGAKTTGQTFYEDISGLDKKSLYYFNAQAKNSAGESAWGAELSFTTLATIPVVTTQAVSSIGGYTATGNGNITVAGGENCNKRGVCWNTTGNPTVADSKSEATNSFGTGAFTRPMTELNPVTHYYVKAYAHNSAGYGYGSQVEFDTKGYYSSGYIGDVIDCTVLVDTYDKLVWTKELPSADQAVVVKIRSSPDESDWSDWETIYYSPCTSFVTPVQRYLEWKATLTTTDDSETPKLEDLSFYWTKKVE